MDFDGKKHLRSVSRAGAQRLKVSLESSGIYFKTDRSFCDLFIFILSVLEKCSAESCTDSCRPLSALAQLSISRGAFMLLSVSLSIDLMHCVSWCGTGRF